MKLIQSPEDNIPNKSPRFPPKFSWTRDIQMTSKNNNEKQITNPSPCSSEFLLGTSPPISKNLGVETIVHLWKVCEKKYRLVTPLKFNMVHLKALEEIHLWLMLNCTSLSSTIFMLNFGGLPSLELTICP